MKVVFDAQTFLRQRTGGISRVFTELIREFDENNSLEVEVRLPFRTTNNALLSTSLPGRGLRTTPDWLPRGVMYAPAWLRGQRIQGVPDVVHRTYYSKRFLGAPSGAVQVTTIHDMIPELFAGTEGFTSTHLAKREYVESCDLVICISESTRRDMSEVYGDIAHRTVVVPNAVQPGFQPGLEPLPGLPSEYLLYVGKRDGYKDFDLLPPALEHLRDAGVTVPLVVVGPRLSREESAAFQIRGMGNSVIYVSLDDEQLRRAYSNCLVLVQTSRYEGFGLTPLEGMASGVPVVIARSSSMPEVGGDVARYFEPGSAESLAEQIESIVTNGNLRSELGVRGMDRARDFTPALMAQRTAAAYREVLDSL